MIFKHFFHRNIIEKKNHTFHFHLTTPFFNKFSRVLLIKKMEILKRDIVLPKYVFNFLLPNWFNYSKLTIQLRTITKI
jgi:hypothetical protein